MDQMNQCVSAYQNDYFWPNVSNILRPQSSTTIIKLCPYNDSRDDKLLDETLDKSFEWSQMIPVLQHLEPKTCSTKIRRFPKVEPTQFEQPCSCVKKIEIECPNLHKILRKLFPEERCLKKTTARIQADRWKTTYQADFSDPAAVRMARSMARSTVERDKLSRIDDMTYHQKVEHCMPMKILIKSDCLPKCCLPLKYYGNNVRKYSYIKNGKKKEKICVDERRKMQIPAWKSEYQDSISKIGQSIIKAKLHKKKSATPVLTISY